MSIDKKLNVAEFIQEFKRLRRESEVGEDFEKLDFYETILQVLYNNLSNFSIENLIPITFNFCSETKAKQFAIPLGLQIVEGGSGTLYLCIADKLEVDLNS